jgi:nickel-dependent lactate racemase
LVKPLHPISEIVARASLEDSRRVRFIGPQQTINAHDAPRIDAAQATFDALASPLEYPPLSAALVPGDRVAIALDEAVPCVSEVVHGVVASLRSAGIEDEAISVVTRSADTTEICRGEFSSNGSCGIRFVVHDPADENAVCLVGQTRKHGPLLVNREIFDADVVLPVGVARVNDAGVYDSLFPRFSDTAAIERFQSPSALTSESSQTSRARETDEAGWLIGAPLVIEVVPGVDETVAHVVAGQPQVVADKARELVREQWQSQTERRASLVITTISGGAQAQNWQNVGRALAAAERLVADGGAIAVCSNLSEPLGQSLGHLVGSEDLEATERKLLYDHASDSFTAWQLARALQRGPVYFLSQLEDETVEEMGMAPVADVEELSRLARRHESYIVLENAQHAFVTVYGDDADLQS